MSGTNNIRWWPGLAIAITGVVVFVILRAIDIWPYEQARTLALLTTVSATGFLLLLWWLIFSRVKEIGANRTFSRSSPPIFPSNSLMVAWSSFPCPRTATSVSFDFYSCNSTGRRNKREGAKRRLPPAPFDSGMRASANPMSFS